MSPFTFQISKNARIPPILRSMASKKIKEEKKSVVMQHQDS